MFQVSPKTAADNLERRTVGLPPQMWAEAEEIGEQLGLKKAETYRLIVAAGILAQKAQLASAVDYENKVLLRQKLQHRQERTFAALEQLESAVSDEEKDEAITRLRECLTD